METLVPKSSQAECSGEVSTLQRLLDSAGSPGRRFAVVTAWLPGASVDENKRADYRLRRELREANLHDRLLYGEWRAVPDQPCEPWIRFWYLDGTSCPEFSSVVRSILKRYSQPVALTGADGNAGLVDALGNRKELGPFDPMASVEAYGKALGGTGTLTFVRAFEEAKVFTATVRRRGVVPPRQE